MDERRLREYSGVYQWSPDSFVYLQLWSELSGKNELIAIDESGDVRTLYPVARDTFFAGPAAALATSIESRINFSRNRAGQLTALEWRRDRSATRIARRVRTERSSEVRFRNGDISLAGTLISPVSGTKHPAIILVHGSGAEDREYLLPFARFLIRHGIAVFGYDKRGVGGSVGSWREASFDDLASDVIAAFRYLRTRPDIDHTRIGLLGWSQAGWIMPIVAVREPNVAFLVSISGAAIPVAETTIDQARNEMRAAGMRPEIIQQIIDLMTLQYRFAQTGRGWQEYAAAREKLVARIGQAPETFPADPDHPQWSSLRLLYFYDPAGTLQKLRTPTLALFGGLDNNIVALRNQRAWDAALKIAGNEDYTLRVFPSANHLMLQAETGTNAEMPTLQRFVPEYFTTVREWVVRRMERALPSR